MGLGTCDPVARADDDNDVRNSAFAGGESNDQPNDLYRVSSGDQDPNRKVRALAVCGSGRRDVSALLHCYADFRGKFPEGATGPYNATSPRSRWWSSGAVPLRVRRIQTDSIHDVLAWFVERTHIAILDLIWFISWFEARWPRWFELEPTNSDDATRRQATPRSACDMTPNNLNNRSLRCVAGCRVDPSILRRVGSILSEWW